MESCSLSPKSRDEQNSLLCADAPTIFATLLTIISAGTGSGKSTDMSSLSGLYHLEGPRKLAVLLCPDDATAQQHERYYTERSGMNPIFLRPDAKCSFPSAVEIVARIKRTPKPVLIAFHPSHRDKRFTASTAILCGILTHCDLAGWGKLVNIDEGDKQNTALCGGLNACPESDEESMKRYVAVCSQDDADSLNFYDILRSVKARVVIWSATLNNLIGSKLMTLGYAAEQVRLINIEPIPELYSTKPFRGFSRDEPDTYWPAIQSVAESGGVNLCVFPSQDALDAFLRKHPAAAAAAVVITCKEDKADLKREALVPRLKTCNFVCAVNMLNGAFDLFSYIGKNFSAIFIFRNSDDSGSNPLSKAPDHELHCDISATMTQVAGRGRDNIVEIYVPHSYAGRNMLEIHRRIHAIIAEAAGECFRYGPVGATQADRMHHAMYVAILHQHRPSGDRPVIHDIFVRLKALTGRDLRVELGSACDHLFWRSAIQHLWQTIFVPSRGLKEEEKQAMRDSLTARSAGSYSRGGGVSQSREDNPTVREAIHERARGRCCHCGNWFEAWEEVQICHVRRSDEGGAFSLDNCMSGHTACDGQYDGSRLIHDVNGSGYWHHQAHTSRWRPERDQVRGISIENICSRWTWARNRICPGVGDFRAWLRGNGYVYCAY
jgi:hypothetical protein